MRVDNLDDLKKFSSGYGDAFLVDHTLLEDELRNKTISQVREILMPYKVFERRAGKSIEWRMSAGFLKRSADILYDNALESYRWTQERQKAKSDQPAIYQIQNITEEEMQRHSDSYLLYAVYMLWGLAIENMAKSILAS